MISNLTERLESNFCWIEKPVDDKLSGNVPLYYEPPEVSKQTTGLPFSCWLFSGASFILS